MKRMDFLTFTGIFLGLILVSTAILLGGELIMFWSPNSVLITIGGSFSTLLIKFKLEQMRKVFKIVQNAFTSKVEDMGNIISKFINLSQKARREGLLSLEDDITGMDDPFMRSGLQMVVDGLEPELIRDIMETELDSLENRHRMGQEVFKFWGASAPAFGMIGTLIGLIQMLANLDDVNAIGPGMAVALLTTLYGALAANLIFIPIAGKLGIRSEEEVAVKVAVIEGVLSIQAGTNPRILQEKMKVYVSPEERKAMEERERLGSDKKSDEEVIVDNA